MATGNGHDYTGHLAVISERQARLETKMEMIPEIMAAANARLDRLDSAVQQLPELKTISALHLARLEQSFTDLSDIKAAISKATDRIGALPCKVHEGDAKVRETKISNNTKLIWANLTLALGLFGKLLYDWITKVAT